MQKKGLFILISCIFFVLIICYFFLNPAVKYLSDYLSKSEKVKANILIVEGWLPDYALELAHDEFLQNKYDYIITTGIKSTDKYINISEPGFLIFYPKTLLSDLTDIGPHSIDIDAYSQLGGDYRAHFNLFINDSLIADFYTEKRKKKYEIIWNNYLTDIDSIMIQFDNDYVGEFGDCNLFVKEIDIDHKKKISYSYNSKYSVLKFQGKVNQVNNLTPIAESARIKLISMGIDSSRIIATPGEKVFINRTLTSALSFKNWLKTSNINIKGINIFSMGTHTRRTWLTYNRVLQEKYMIGIISLPDNLNNSSSKNKVLKTIRETIGIIYYWFILLPF
jgi:hypothetical protein